MPRFARLCTLFAFLACLSSASAQPRDWRTVTGEGFKGAELVGVDKDGNAQLKISGAVIKMPLVKLSAADREYVKQWQKEQAELKEKPPENVVRVWTNISGGKKEGKFLSLQGNIAYFAGTDARPFYGPVDQFVEADQKLIRKLALAAARKPKKDDLNIPGVGVGPRKLPDPGPLPIEPENPLTDGKKPVVKVPDPPKKGGGIVRAPSETGAKVEIPNNPPGGGIVRGGHSSPPPNNNSGGGGGTGARTVRTQGTAQPVAAQNIRPATFSDVWSGRVFWFAVFCAIVGGAMFAMRKINEVRDRGEYAGDMEDE